MITKTATAKKAKVEKSASPDDMISLVSIAREINMDSKRARQKARKSKVLRELSPDPVHWMFPKASKQKVIDTLKASTVPTPK